VRAVRYGARDRIYTREMGERGILLFFWAEREGGGTGREIEKRGSVVGAAGAVLA
jgi:hypothetical protein